MCVCEPATRDAVDFIRVRRSRCAHSLDCVDFARVYWHCRDLSRAANGTTLLARRGQSLPKKSEPLDGMTVDEARRRCFDPDGESATWEAPGTSLVARKVALCVVKRVFPSSSVYGSRDEIFNDARNEISRRFERPIWSSFRSKRDRRQTWTNFERFLHRSIEHEVLEQIRKQRIQRLRVPGENGGWQDAIFEPLDKELSFPDDMGTIGAEFAREVLECLSSEERELLDARFEKDHTAAEIAGRLGRSEKRIQNRISEAKASLRHAMLQVAVRRYLELHGTVASDTEPIVKTRCKGGHDCLLYSLECGNARTLEEMFKSGAGSMLKEVEERFARLHRAVEVGLRDCGFPGLLGDNVCLWAPAAKRKTRKPEIEAETE